jgi:hypothetical protein
MNILKFIFSFLYPVTIEKTSSAFNPLLEIRIENGKYVLNAAHANYSFGSLHKIFFNAFRQIKIGERGIQNVLLLGFGGGSVPVLLFEEFKLDCKITAIEIDEKVIELSKKYFNIQRFENLNLVCADAFEFVQKCDSNFDLVVVDLFIDNKVPFQFESTEFFDALKKLMENPSILLFNKIIGIEDDSTSFDTLLKNIELIFNQAEVLPIFENRIIVVETKK